jgi:hypothetical protein
MHTLRSGASLTAFYRLRGTLVWWLSAYLLMAASTAGNVSAQEQAVSAKVPSADVDRPETIDVGEVVKGRLGNSNETGKAHYWAITLSPGAYKVVLDVRRADDHEGNVGGTLEWFSVDGKRIDSLGSMNEVDDRFRSVFRFSLKAPLKALLRYSNDFTVSDYWLGVFKADATFISPFFIKPPAVYPLRSGEPATAILRGEVPIVRDAYYSIRLPAGDYKVKAEYRRSDGKSGNVGGQLSALDTDGQFRGALHFANAVDVFTREINKLSLADETVVLFKLRALFTEETVSLTLEPFTP